MNNTLEDEANKTMSKEPEASAPIPSTPLLETPPPPPASSAPPAPSAFPAPLIMTPTIPGNNDYNPHDHRIVHKPTNNFETFVHILKSSLGTGILAMPQAFSKAGLIIGAVFFSIIGLIVGYCIQQLVRMQYILCKMKRVPLMTYPETMRAAIEIGPPCLRRCKNVLAVSSEVFIIIYQLGSCCIYTVFMASSIKKLVDPYYVMSLELHMLCLLLPLIILNLIRNLKALAPLSTVANLLILLGLAIVIYYMLTLEPSKSSLNYWGSPVQFPLFVGTSLFALTAVGVVLAVENNMKTPAAFGLICGPFNLALLLVLLVYVFIGVVGYMFCRSECKDSITLNLPETEGLAMTVSVAYILAIFISYALHYYVPLEIIWKQYLFPCLTRRRCKQMLALEYVFRAVICTLCFILAISVPQLGLFISLFGALCLSSLTLMYPALLEICVCYPTKSYGVMKYKLIKDLCIIFIGFVALIAGTYSAIAAIVLTFIK